ncbi:MAG: hypothetical protein FD126_23 [Elusimicrobia bacterium]|nr:MAG: hypothetical protein FD126_23 [Elusimicrobiota bacterium]
MKQTPRQRRGARLAPVWGLLASFIFLSTPKAFAVDSITGNFAAPTGVVFDSGGQDRAQAIGVDPSSNVYVAGYKPGGGGNDWVILKLDPSGVMLSSAAFDSGGDDQPRDLIVGGGTLTVVGKAGGLRHMRFYSSANLQLIGTYQDGVSGSFNAIISSGPNLITSTLGGGTLLINEFTTGGSLVLVATHNPVGVYLSTAANHNLARDGAGWIYFAVVKDDTKVLRLERLGAGLSPQGSLEFNEPDDFISAAAVAATPSGDVYSVAVGSLPTGTNNHIYRTNGVASLLAGTTVFGPGIPGNGEERAVVIDPSNLDVYYAGSGPFPGIQKFSSDLAGATQKTLFPTSSLAILNGANMYATEVNQQGAQDYVAKKFDFNALSAGGGGGGGVNEPASDGTYIYLGRTDSESPGMAELYKISPPNTLVSSGTISGLAPDQDIKILYAGASLYVVGAASGPTTSKIDAAVFKINPSNMLMVSSRTLDSTTGQGDDIVMSATVTPTGNLFLAGAVQNSATTYLGAVWNYDTGTGALTLLSALNAAGSNTDLFDGVASTGSSVYWMVGYSSFTADSGRDKMALSLWKYQAGSLQFVSDRAGFADSLDYRSRITASNTELFVAAERRNSANNRDLVYIKYDLSGTPVHEKVWHSQSPARQDIVGGIVLDASGDPVITGGTEDVVTSSGTSAYWRYTAATGALVAGFPKTLGDGRFYAPARHGADTYASVHASSTPILLTGGSAISGAEGQQGAAAPLSFTFTGGPNTALKINTTINQHEAAQHVFVDTTTGNFYVTWKSSSVSFAEPDAGSLGKFNAAGTMLASTTLMGNKSGGAGAYLNGFLYFQERNDDYSLLQYTKFDANLGRVFSRALSSAVIGNVTNAVTFDSLGFIYVACDGAGAGAPELGGMKVIKFDANLNELARATYTNVASGFHHNNDALAISAGGTFFVAVSSSEAGPVKHLVKYDVNLVQMTSANVTAHFPDSTAQLASGAGGILYALGHTNPAVEQKVFVRAFNETFLYQNNSTTITVTGATPSAFLSIDPDRNAIVTLTSSTADGGDFAAFKFNPSLVQLSSGLFDAGFSGADSGMAGVAVDTATVYLSGMGGNGGHKDAVVMKRSLPAAAAAVPATRIWAGTNFGDASLGSNWVGGVAPTNGDSVVFGSTNPLNSCNFNLSLTLGSVRFEGAYKGGVDLSSAVTVSDAFEMVGDTNAIVRFVDAPANIHTLNGAVTLTSGTFHIGQTTVVAVGSITVNSGGIAEMHDQALFQGSKIHVTQGNGRLRLYDVGALPGGPTLTSTGTAAVLRVIIDGVVDISSGTFQRLSKDGLQIGPSALIVNLSSVTFAGPLPAGSTAVNFDLPGTVAIATMTNVAFNAANIAVNVAGSSLTTPSRISMRRASGAKAGPSFENDPNNYIDWYDTVAAAPASPALTFAGTFGAADGARVTSSNGFNVVGHQVLVDTVTAGGPFVYAVFSASTSVQPGASPSVEFIVRYDASGVFLSSVTLLDDQGGNGLTQDSAGDIYIANSGGEGLPIGDRSIGKFTKELAFVSSVTLFTNNVGPMAYDGTNLFASADGAHVLRLNTSLAPPTSAFYSATPGFNGTLGIALDGAGNLFAGVEKLSGGGVRLLRYPAAFANNAGPDVDVSVDTITFAPRVHQGAMASIGGNLFIAANSTDGTKTYFRKFDAGLNYTGVSATFTNTTAQFGTRLIAGADGTLYAATSVSGTVSNDAFLALRYDTSLVLLSSAVFNGIGNTGGAAAAVAVLNPSNVFLTGTSSNGQNPGDYKGVTVVRNLSGAPALVHAKGASEFVVSETDNNEFILDAAYGSAKFLYSWQVKVGTINAYVGAQFVTAAGALSGSPIAFNSGSPAGWCGESAPNVASDGTNFLLVAGCGANNQGKTQAVVVAASGSLGAKVDLNAGHAGFDIEHGNVAFDGTNYLVLWSSGAGTQRDVFGRFVSSGGALAGSPFAVATAAGHEREPNVVYGGAKYLAVWHDDTRLSDGNDADIMGQFILPNQTLDGAPFRIDAGNLGSRNPVHVGYNGTNYFVVYHEGPQGQYGISGAIVTSTGGVANRFTIESESGPNSHLAVTAPVWEGDRWRVMWSDIVGHVGSNLVALSTTVIEQQTFTAAGAVLGGVQQVAAGVSGKIPYTAGMEAGNGTTLAGIDRADIGGGFENTANNDVYGLLISSGWSTTPPPAVSSVTLAFTGNFTSGARAANDAGGADLGSSLAFLNVGPSTFVYAMIHSTSISSPGQTPNQTQLVKYDMAGVVLASTTLLGNASGDTFVAEGGFLFVSEKDLQPSTMRRLVKYDADLNRLLTTNVDAASVGNITRGAGRNGFLYTINDGGSSSPGAKLIKYDAGLNEVRRATNSFGADHANGNSVIVTPNGELFVQVFSSNVTKFVKYDENLNPLIEANVSSLFPANAERTDLAFSNGILLAASFDSVGDKVLVRKFDPSLNYSGASSTIAAQVSPGFSLKAGPDGLFYVAFTSYSADGGNYSIRVIDGDLVLKASTSFDAGFNNFDNALGLAVVNSSNVFVTGTAYSGVNYEAVTFVKNLSAAGGGVGGAGGQPGGFSGLANKDSRVWAVQRGLGVVRRYDFPSPPLSRTTAFAQELNPGNGAVRPTTLGVDGGGNLWVSVSTSMSAEGNTRLVRYASQGGPGEVALATSGVLSSLLNGVHAIAFRPGTGDLWVANGGNNPSIVSILRDGGSTLAAPTFSNAGASTFTTTAELPIAESLAFDSAGNLWVTSRNLGQIRKYPLSAGNISQSTSQFITALSTPGALTFDTAGNMYVGETNETTQFTGKLWKFVNQGTQASPVISNTPVLLQSGVDPAALAFIAGQLWGASDLNDQVATHPTEPPAPPPQFAAAQGRIYYDGPRTGGSVKIAFSTQPYKVSFSDPATVLHSTAVGPYSVATLAGNNTYYALTFLDINSDINFTGVEPYGLYGASTGTFGPRTGFYVGVDQTAAGIDMRLWDRVAVTGTVTNLSAQTGSLLMQTWIGAPNDADPRGRTDSHDTFAANATSYALYTATASNIHIRAFIDQNNSAEYESGEDNVVLGPLVALGSALADSTTSLNIAIGSSPAGQMFFNAASIAGANIPTNGEAAFLKLNAWSGTGNVQFRGLRVTLKGDAPAPNVFVKVYKDANGDGAFQQGVDPRIGEAFFTSNVPPTANVTFDGGDSTQTVTASTRAFFVGLNFGGLPAGKSAGLAIDAASAFTFSAGSLAPGQGPFPVESALSVAQFSLAARPSEMGYPNPQGGANPSGGFDTGLYVNVGQRLEVNASGVWNTGALGTSGPGGLSGQTSTSAPAGSVDLGALIGRIGGSAWFKVGASTSFISGQSGSLALAMNDANYGDNSAALAVDFHIVPSTTTRVWLGNSGFGQGADIAQNWQGGLVPASGESVVFDGTASNANCDWTLYYANVGRLEMKNGYSGRVRLMGSSGPDDFNTLNVSSHMTVSSGTFDLGRNKLLIVEGLLSVGVGTLDMGTDNTRLQLGNGLEFLSASGLFRSVGTGVRTLESNRFDRGQAVFFSTVNVDGLSVNHVKVSLGTSANVVKFDKVSFEDFSSQTTAPLDVANFANLTFRGHYFGANFAKNVTHSVPSFTLTMQDAVGPKRGSPFEDDLFGNLIWNPDGGGSPASISGTVIDGGGVNGSTVVVRGPRLHRHAQRVRHVHALGARGPCHLLPAREPGEHPPQP